jgi:hypothetical protein
MLTNFYLVFSSFAPPQLVNTLSARPQGKSARMDSIPKQPMQISYHGCIGSLEDAEDSSAFEAAIIADYDAQSAVERDAASSPRQLV